MGLVKTKISTLIFVNRWYRKRLPSSWRRKKFLPHFSFSRQLRPPPSPPPFWLTIFLRTRSPRQLLFAPLFEGLLNTILANAENFRCKTIDEGIYVSCYERDAGRFDRFAHSQPPPPSFRNGPRNEKNEACRHQLGGGGHGEMFFVSVFDIVVRTHRSPLIKNENRRRRKLVINFRRTAVVVFD